MRAGPLAPALLALAFLFASVASAQPRPPAPAAAATDRHAETLRVWTQEIAAAEAQLGRARLTNQELDELRVRLADLRARAHEERDVAEAAAGAARRLLDVLGPPPAADRPPEAESVAAERRGLTAEVTRSDGLARQAELAAARAQALLDGIGLRRRELLFAELTRRGDSALDPQEWVGAARDLPGRWRQRLDDWHGWWNSPARADLLPAALQRALLRAALAGAALAALGVFLRRRFGRGGRPVAATYAARLAAILADAILTIATPVAVVLVLSGTVLASGALAPQVAAAVHGWASAAIMLVLGFVGGRLAFQPDSPGWRAVPLGNGSARRLARNVDVIAVVTALNLAAKPALFGATGGFGDPDLRTVFEAIAVFAVGVALAALARKGNWKPGGEVAVISGAPVEAGAARGRRGDGLRFVWVAAVVAALVATLAGYARLAEFILTNLFFSAVILTLGIAARVAARELLQALARPAPGEERGDLFGWWALRLAELAIAAFALLAILPIWGVGWDEIGDFAWRALYGLKIGNYTVSLINVVAAVAAFIAIRFVTRVAQRSFERTVLPQTRLDPGVGNSIRAGIGYVGLALALLAAIGAVGLDLTNVALVAGALSVGIGFGLQNIVNNFVSGIILLIERPIKVGDWVVVGQHEGTVKRISVRATEIETFRRSSVIIPNAEFLSSAVVNWTYADRHGRVDIRVGVAYGTDVGRVEAILLELARAEPRLLSSPAPFVLVTNFGDSAIDLELRGVARDAGTMAFIGSDLRKRILERFAAEGIEIPFPQRVVNVRGGTLPPDEAAAAAG